MKHILVIGAGRSASSLIKYLLDHSEEQNWTIRVGDVNEETAQSKINGHSRGTAFKFNASDVELRRREIEISDLIISMLPASMHVDIVKDCIELKKNVLTPSYVSPAMKALHEDAKKAGIIVLNEMGVDPGIDHMSAMEIIDNIRDKGGKMLGFESFCGGLLAPKSDDNPWHYKFTWSPRNVILAGQGGMAQFIRRGQLKYLPYHRLFNRIEHIHIPAVGEFEGYANRDSLSYREVYGLEKIPSMIRGTLRQKGFCPAWDVFVQLGITDDSFLITDMDNMTWRSFINSFLDYEPSTPVEDKVCEYVGIDRDSETFRTVEWTGIFEDTPIGLDKASPAKALQHLLEQKWLFKKEDRDMIVMFHRFNYELNGKTYEKRSSMAYVGKDYVYGAMSDTVGLPAAIGAKMILNGEIKRTGVVLPVTKDIYAPILRELESLGIHFSEEEEEKEW